MKYSGGKSKNDLMRYAIYTVLAVLLSLIQFSLLDFLEVKGITPDLPLLLCIWIAIKEGRFKGVVAGFLIGLTLDIVSFDLVGTNAFTKTIAAFVAGSFYKEGKEDKILHSLMFLLIVFVSSFIHNIIYFIFYIRLSEASATTLFIKYGLAFSFYTTVFGIIPMLVKRKEKLL